MGESLGAVTVEIVRRARQLDVGGVVGCRSRRAMAFTSRMRISVSAVGCTTSVGMRTAGMVSAVAAADERPDHVDGQPRTVTTLANPPYP